MVQVVLLGVLGVGYDYTPSSVAANAATLPVFGNSIVAGLGGYAFLFVCQDVSVEVIHTMHKPTRNRYRGVLFTGMGIALATQLAVGMSLLSFLSSFARLTCPSPLLPSSPSPTLLCYLILS